MTDSDTWRQETVVARGSMNSHSYLAVMVLSFVLATLQAGKTRGEDPVKLTWNPKAAATYLDGRAREWLNWSGAARGQGTVCLSCHTGMPIALARPAVGERLGETAPGALEKGLIDNVKKRVANWDRIVA